MAGNTFDGMELPKRPHRPDLDTRNADGIIRFEKLKASRKEDTLRAKLIGQSIAAYPDLFGAEATDLMRRLQNGIETRVPPRTPASSVHMRGIRIRVIGHLWALVEDES